MRTLPAKQIKATQMERKALIGIRARRPPEEVLGDLAMFFSEMDQLITRNEYRK